jgi:hypothetical protein
MINLRNTEKNVTHLQPVLLFNDSNGAQDLDVRKQTCRS